MFRVCVRSGPGEPGTNRFGVSRPERDRAMLRTGTVIRMSPMTWVNPSLISSGVTAFLRYSSVIRLLASVVWNTGDQTGSFDSWLLPWRQRPR